MKKIAYSLLLFLTLSASVNAQTEKGRWEVGTQVGNFSYQTQNGSRSFSGSIAPSAGYFVIDNLLVGAGIPVSYSAYSYPSSVLPPAKSSVASYGINPLVRYYFGKGRLKPYVGLAYSYSRTVINTGQLVDRTDKGRTINLAPTGGVAYFITNNVALNAGLNYNIQTYKSENLDANLSPVTGSYEQKFGSLGIGFQIFFGK